MLPWIQGIVAGSLLTGTILIAVHLGNISDTLKSIDRRLALLNKDRVQ